MAVGSACVLMVSAPERGVLAFMIAKKTRQPALSFFVLAESYPKDDKR